MASDPVARRPLVDAVQGELRALTTEIDHLDQLAADRFGLNRTDLRALVDILGRAEVVTATELARALGFTTGGVTTVIDRLEQAGYARRRPDPTDRRRVLVEATKLTGDRGAEVFGRLIGRTEEIARTYSDAELAVIRDFLGRWRAAITTHGDALSREASTTGPAPARSGSPRPNRV